MHKGCVELLHAFIGLQGKIVEAHMEKIMRVSERTSLHQLARLRMPGLSKLDRFSAAVEKQLLLKLLSL